MHGQTKLPECFEVAWNLLGAYALCTIWSWRSPGWCEISRGPIRLNFLARMLFWLVITWHDAAFTQRQTYSLPGSFWNTMCIQFGCVGLKRDCN
jgi:hypothetical protein